LLHLGAKRGAQTMPALIDVEIVPLRNDSF
jgi:hypothetical protein